MRYSTIALALAAVADARAADLDKRGLVTVTRYIDIWSTVYLPVDAAFATPAASASAAAAAAGVVNARADSGIVFGRPKSSSKRLVFGQQASSTKRIVFGQQTSRPSSVAAASSSSAAASPVASLVPPPSPPASPSAAPASSSAAAASPSAVATGPGAAYIDAVLFHHNVHRANHSAPALVWSDSLYSTALKIANTCNYGHSMDVDGGGYGQNIAAGMPIDRIAFVITEQFYNGEVNYYSYYGQATPNMDQFKYFGHFTQVVWVNTRNVACASVDCSAREGKLQNVASNVPPIYHVCNYSPPGNYLGQFDTNVLRPRNDASIHA